MIHWPEAIFFILFLKKKNTDRHYKTIKWLIGFVVTCPGWPYTARELRDQPPHQMKLTYKTPHQHLNNSSSSNLFFIFWCCGRGVVEGRLSVLLKPWKEPLNLSWSFDVFMLCLYVCHTLRTSKWLVSDCASGGLNEGGWAVSWDRRKSEQQGVT